MTGPEHYANAESDLEHAARADDRGHLADVTYWLGCAQVHAALALAAATALSQFGHMPPRDASAWLAVAEEPEAGR